MSHINITNLIVRYDDGRINEKATCDNIDADLKNHGYDYVRAYFTNSFSYFKNKTPQLRIIIDGSKAGWSGAHTKKFVLVKHDNIDKDKVHYLNLAGKQVVDWKKDWDDDKNAKINAHNTALDDGIKALYRYMATANIVMGSDQYTNIIRSINALKGMMK